jgi:putative FmdB family regulatory protein
LPKYAYRCSACDARYDRVEGFDAPSRHDCPECGGLSKRQFSAPTIVFKGSGWYATDNKRTLRDGAVDSTSTDEKPAAAASDSGHGHSHGPGGHSHGHSHPHTPAAAASSTTSSSSTDSGSASSEA